MTSMMTDPTNALISFQDAIDCGAISPSKSATHSDVLTLTDRINGVPRFTCALVRNNRIAAIAIFVPTDQINDSLCLAVGYAVDKPLRSHGLGKEVTSKAIDELRAQLSAAGHEEVYIEAVVSVSNSHSNKLAKSVLSKSPKSTTDAVSGEPALQYIRRII